MAMTIINATLQKLKEAALQMLNAFLIRHNGLTHDKAELVIKEGLLPIFDSLVEELASSGTYTGRLQIVDRFKSALSFEDNEENGGPLRDPLEAYIQNITGFDDPLILERTAQIERERLNQAYAEAATFLARTVKNKK